MKESFYGEMKCKECGKEFQLGEGENPSDFQCDCGGNLGYVAEITREKLVEEIKPKKSIPDFRKTFNKKSSKSKTEDKEVKAEKDYSKDFNKLRSLLMMLIND